MKAHLTHVDGEMFRLEAEESPAIILHAPRKGERRAGPSPMQAALLAAMGCTAADVVSILSKQHISFTSFEISAEAERATTEPKVLTRVHLHFTIRGEHVKERDVQRAIDLSTEKYCSVGIMMRRGGVQWKNTLEILPPK